MGWYEAVFEVIDMRSFSNLWYWIGLAVVWSSASHWVLGVPYDMVLRARRRGGEAERDLEDLVRINVNRLLYIVQLTGVWLLALGSAVLSALAVLGFWYGVEFAQAVFLILFPLSLVGLMSISTASRIRSEGATGAHLHRRLFRHRLLTQVVGMVSVFLTAMWGMYQNLVVGPFGG